MNPLTLVVSLLSALAFPAGVLADPPDADALRVMPIGGGTAATIVRTDDSGVLLMFDEPVRDGSGPDLNISCDVMHVEVSTDGEHFARFLLPIQADFLSGRSRRNLSSFTSTSGRIWYDLSKLEGHPHIVAHKLDLQEIRFVRLVGIEGAASYTTPATDEPMDSENSDEPLASAPASKATTPLADLASTEETASRIAASEDQPEAISEETQETESSEPAADDPLPAPYSLGADDPTNTFDAPIPGYVGPAGEGTVFGNDVNPLFVGWATSAPSYLPATSYESFSDTDAALGPVNGDVFDVVSLGDRDTSELTAGDPAGTITLTFDRPIRNRHGADLTVFENGFYSQFEEPDGDSVIVIGQISGELAYVEVSTDGINFARFPSDSLTPSLTGPLGTLDPTHLYNLAGKHANGYGPSWGTPFDLSSLATDSLVIGGQVDLNEINYVRIVDIPGEGSFLDASGDSIFDAWLTYALGTGSAGFDLDAVGVVSHDVTFAQFVTHWGFTSGQDDLDDDPDNDGITNLEEYACGSDPLTANEKSVTYSFDGSEATVTLIHDTRAVEARIVVEASATLTANGWTELADSSGGADITSLVGASVQTSSVSTSSIASVGVIRQATVVETVAASTAKRFHRVRKIFTPLVP